MNIEIMLGNMAFRYACAHTEDNNDVWCEYLSLRTKLLERDRILVEALKRITLYGHPSDLVQVAKKALEDIGELK